MKPMVGGTPPEPQEDQDRRDGHSVCQPPHLLDAPSPNHGHEYSRDAEKNALPEAMGHVVKYCACHTELRRACKTQENVSHLADTAVGKEALYIVLSQCHEPAINHGQ
jgi:hypothetical protein